MKAVRTASERRSLKLGEANCLLDAVDGNLNGRWEQNATNPQRVALSSLLQDEVGDPDAERLPGSATRLHVQSRPGVITGVKGEY